MRREHFYRHDFVLFSGTGGVRSPQASHPPLDILLDPIVNPIVMRNLGVYPILPISQKASGMSYFLFCSMK